MTSAKSEVSIIETTPQQDGTIIVTADISTEFTYNGESEPGNWSDRHLITLSQGSSGYIVTADEIDDSAAEEAAIAGEVPDGYNPTPSSDDPTPLHYQMLRIQKTNLPRHPRGISNLAQMLETWLSMRLNGRAIRTTETKEMTSIQSTRT